jgi:uncharacterized membrane protein (UPF0136 family)
MERERGLRVFCREFLDNIGALLADIQYAYMSPLFGEGTDGGQSYATCASWLILDLKSMRVIEGDSMHVPVTTTTFLSPDMVGVAQRNSYSAN